MIIKNYEINKINTDKNSTILFYGKNDGHKNEVLNKITHKKGEILRYDQNEILENQKIFFENILSGSLFENNKVIIIKRVTDKLINLIEEIDSKKIDSLIIILISDNLEKKSKLRSMFEKHKNFICIAFYPDTEQALTNYVINYLKPLKINLSRSNINFIVNRSNGDRGNLLNELQKIELYCKKNKKLTDLEIAKLINLIENHNISELIDNFLVNNKKKLTSILNENNFSNEDCVLITRTFLNKSKKLLKLADELKNNNNMELTISSAKPPIFWKDKEIIKQQLNKWKPEQLKI